jgi:hydroxyacylglutathione hydrolase
VEAGLPVVDIRTSEEYAARHLPGTTNIPWGNDFLSWAGWLLPYDRPLGVVVNDGDVLRVREELQLIGLDHVEEYWTPQVLRNDGVQRPPEIKRHSASDLAPLINRIEPGKGGHPVLLDVRAPSEHTAGHIAGSVNIPLYQLESRLGEIPQGQPILVYCAAGSRSAVAVSILNNHGWHDITEMYDGFDAWQRRGCPVERAGANSVPYTGAVPA